jgi:LysM domain-containing protein
MKKAIISLIFLLTFATPAVAASPEEVRPDAPERYTVVPGDTLWGIASRFLKSPWRWPELWELNRTQIRNPHRIYPGDVVVLERKGNQVFARLETTRLSPQVRSEPLESAAIPTIAPSDIEPFLSKPLVITATELDGTPQIVATQEDRVAVGSGNTAYAEKLAPEDSRWQIFRRGDPLIDPETKETLGYVAIYLGEAALVRRGDISTIAITRATQEIYRGDKLLPVPKDHPVFSYVPHAPQAAVQGRIVSTYGGLWETGPLSIVALSRGTRDGLEVGHVLALYRDQRSTRYAQRTEPNYGRSGPTGNDDRITYYPAPLAVRSSPLYTKGQPVQEGDFSQFPAERYGVVMVFRTFERASFAIVMHATRPVAVADIIVNP